MCTSLRAPCLYAFLAFTFPAGNARRETVCFSFSATVTDVRPGLSAFAIPNVDAGAVIAGSFSYDTRAAGSQGEGGTLYTHPDLQVKVSIGGVESLPDSTRGQIRVADGPLNGGSDRFELFGNTLFTDVLLIILSLEDANGAVWISEELPRTLDLRRFTSASLEARSMPGDGRSFLFSARLDSITPCGPKEPPFKRADVNADGVIDLTDPVAALSFLFLGGPEPTCLKAVDANDDGALDLSDPVYTLNYLFSGGAVPANPFPACGTDPTADALACGSQPSCP